MAILKFRVYWEDDDSVYRDVVIKHIQTFFELHKMILKCFEFDNKHNATFFRSNDKWQRGKEITLEKYEKKYEVQPLLMNDVTIGSEIRDPNQKFIYVYDFHKNWTFMVELINVNKEEDNKASYPLCTRSEGIGPSQYGTKGLINEKLAEIEEKYDLNSAVMPDGFSEEGISDTETEASPDEDVEENSTEEI
jgi:Plasmid pRiA4b ORF-3-like protein